MFKHAHFQRPVILPILLVYLSGLYRPAWTGHDNDRPGMAQEGGIHITRNPGFSPEQ
jgi:hypothetical protein